MPQFVPPDHAALVVSDLEFEQRLRRMGESAKSLRHRSFAVGDFQLKRGHRVHCLLCNAKPILARGLCARCYQRQRQRLLRAHLSIKHFML